MPNLAAQARAKCPFFIRCEDRYICCEGFTARCITIIRFDDAECKAEWMRERCERYDWDKKCPLARQLGEKYG